MMETKKVVGRRFFFKKRLLVWLLAVVVALPQLAFAQTRDVILHMFNYPFKAIRADLPQIAANGYGRIQISPPQLSNGGPWWGRYQPVDYRVIDGPLGNEAELKLLIDEAAKYKIDIVADLVLNHMANFGGDFDLNYPPQAARQQYGVGGLFSPWDFHSRFCIGNYNNPGEVRYGRLCGGGGDAGLPDLNTESDYVLGVHRQYVDKLNKLGVKGYRVDAVKHMPPEYMNKVFTPDLVGTRLVFGEVIANEFSFDRDLEEYLRVTRIGYMDFPLQETLRRAFGIGGSLQELINPVVAKRALAWDRAVTFVVNHDIPNNDGFRYMILDPQDETLSYAFLLGRDGGVPQVYSDLGQADGLVDNRWRRAHDRADLGAMVRFHNQMLGQGMVFQASSPCFLLFSRGIEGIVGVNKCGEEAAPWIKVGEGGRFRDALSTRTLESSNGWYQVRVPGRSAVMFARERVVPVVPTVAATPRVVATVRSVVTPVVRPTVRTARFAAANKCAVRAKAGRRPARKCLKLAA